MNVIIAIYEHRFGTTVRVFTDEEKAQIWQTSIAEEYWNDEFPNEPRPPRDEIGEQYFFLMEDRAGRSEYFEIHGAEVE